MPLYRLLYKSEVALRGDAKSIDRQIEDIVADAAIANLENGIYGALITCNDVFIQVLEGPLGKIEATFERICSDLRHRHVRLIELEATEERLFEDWQMVRVDVQEDLWGSFADLELGSFNTLDRSKTPAIVSLMRSRLTTSKPGSDSQKTD